VTEPILATAGLGRRFGGLEAARDVSIELRPGELHALLGPNGAGKTTVINLLSGDLPATSGTIRHRGRDITRLSPDRRSRLGIGRSYQRTSIFPALSVFENCRLAAQSRRPRALRLLSDGLDSPPTNEAAGTALESVGLPPRDSRVAASLSHGEQRQLEIAMVLATGPEVLLLDEPLAGMGPEEAQLIVGLLRTLVPGRAILLVEHDLDAVFALADVVTVMAGGQILASGSTDVVRASPAVQRAYLGEEQLPGAGRGGAS
jgi:branched-chain amino acid transport system ATP-binding protein